VGFMSNTINHNWVVACNCNCEQTVRAIIVSNLLEQMQNSNHCKAEYDLFLYQNGKE
jgi:hypothetical protein